MFVLTTLVYPAVLALLCVGAALLVDRACGEIVPAALFPAVGMASLIVVSQLSTYVGPLAPATPYLVLAFALAGPVLASGRLRVIAGDWRMWRWRPLWMAIVYLLALAPVLAAGRPTFSSYMILADSSVHMLGADYLIQHGQHYSHLDLANSYGATLHAYYGSSYPSGADTLLGASASLMGLPLTWTFQPFVAFSLATAFGPAWMLARHIGLGRGWASLAALTAVTSALVYAYELIGSVKEIVSLSLILVLGALVVEHRCWLGGGARGAIPLALSAAAGLATLGIAFGAWTLAAIVALIAVALSHRGRLLASAALGSAVLLVAAWPTWADVSGSLQVAGAVASTSNPGNLHSPLRAIQLLGVWLGGSYKLLPTGVSLTLTYAICGVVLAAAVVGVGYAVRSGRYALACWLVLAIFLWLVLANSTTTWATAKTLVLTAPAVVLAAWAGVAALWRSPLRLGAGLVALLLVGGVAVSDALQYHESNLAPTARYEELASIDERFAGRGPTLFTDFDEYALYELRDMDVGGPSFAYPPPAAAAAADGYGRPVKVGRITPRALRRYPLIVTRREAVAERPPAAYRLLWSGIYYEVWGRRAGASAALAHVTLAGVGRIRCERVVAHAMGVARARRARVVVSLAPASVNVPVPRSHFRRPPGWARSRAGVLMRRPGTLRVTFALPSGGVWRVWLEGEAMRRLELAVDGRPIGSLAGQLGGNSLVGNALTPLSARLAAGRHTLAIARTASDPLAPGDGGAALLSAIQLTPAGAASEPRLRAATPDRVAALCARAPQWLELVRD